MAAKADFTVHTGLSFDPKSKSFKENISFLVSATSGLIKDLKQRPGKDVPTLGPDDVDLRSLIVIPGLVDAHTHIFLHAYSEVSAQHQMLSESYVERIIRATNHVRTALLTGYTTYRDLGSEGMQDADLHIRNAINRGLIPGPRLFVATNPIASSGGYTIPHEDPSGHTSVHPLADVADGVEGVRAAVRRRIGAGADIIKFYADQEKRVQRFPEPAYPGALPIQFPPEDEKPQHYLLFSPEEMAAIVAEAHESKCIVAAHASSPEAVIRAANAGVDTIEHGQDPSDEALAAMKAANSIFVPTLAVMEEEVPEHAIQSIYNHTLNAFNAGIKLACGGDIGPVPHGENARELELMIAAGMPVEEVLTAATLHGWEACGGDRCGRRFGWFEKGVAADFVGLTADPRKDEKAFRKVDFVMKDGKLWKTGGKAVEW